MKNCFLAFVFLLLLSVSLRAQAPTDNPIATFYENSTYASEGYPTWTDDIKWNNVINMYTFATGANDFEKFENARDILYAQGGGVLYYPAGTYDFKDHPTGPNDGRGLHLKKGVVIRGEAPGTNKWAVKDWNTKTDDAGLSDLQTVFVFPTWDKKTTPQGEFMVVAGNGLVPRTWNQVGLMPDKANGEHIRDVNYVGIAWIKFQFATVYFGEDFGWDEVSVTYATAGAFKSSSAKTTNEYGQNWAARVPDGTHPFDPFTGSFYAKSPNPPLGSFSKNGSKCRFVFGCRFENAVVHDDIYNHGSDANTKMYGYFGSRFCGRVIVSGEHLLVANNIIPKPTESFYYNMKIKLLNSTYVIAAICYDYARSMGFDVNKSFASQRGNNCILTGADKGAYFLDNMIVQDNYTWQHGNKGYDLAGKWGVIRRNVREGKVLLGYSPAQNSTSDDVYGFGMNFNGGKGWLNTLQGETEVKGADDNMSRGFDMGGWNLFIDNNYVNGQGSWPGNDGEGILWQDYKWITVLSVAVTNNEQGPNVSCPFAQGTSYIFPYGTYVMGMFQGWNKVLKAGNGGATPRSVEDYSVIGNTNPTISRSTSNYLDEMYDADCSGAANGAPTSFSALIDNENKCTIISWTDGSTNEAAFRVERRERGTSNWTILAYRPRNETGGYSGSLNPNGWIYPASSPDGTNPNCTNQELDMNPQQWYDYTASPKKQWEYRIVAIGCDPNDATIATPVFDPVQSNVKFVNDTQNGLLIYPVPAVENLNVRMENKYNGKLNIAIMDMQGKIVKSMPFYKTADVLNVTYPISELKTGVYYVSFTGNGFYTSHRVVKQ